MGIAAATLAAAGGCSNAPAEGTARNLGNNTSWSGSFGPKWEFDLPLPKGDTVRRIYLIGDTVYVYSTSNTVFAVSAAGGELKYIAPVASPELDLHRPIPMGEKNDRVVFPTNDALEVYSRRGTPVRTIHLSYSLTSDGVASGNVAYMGADIQPGGRLVQTDISQPYDVLVTRWTLSTFGAVTGSPAVYQNICFVGSQDGGVRAVNPDRTSQWGGIANGTFKTDGKILGDIKVDDAGVYAASTDQKFYCIDRITGRLKWQYYASAALKEGPAVTASTIYQPIPGGQLVALDKTKTIKLGPDGPTVEEFDRQPRWVCKQADEMLGEDDRFCFARGDDNTVIALDKKTGQERFRSGRNDLIYTQNEKGPDVYGVTKDGKIFDVQLNPNATLTDTGK